MCAFLGTCEHEVNVGVAVGDEAFHTVEKPATVFFGICCAQHYALQVTACVGLGKVHRHGLSFAYARNETLALVFITELVKSFNAILQAPDVAEACVTGSDDFSAHRVRSNGEVQTVVTAGHCHTVHSGSNHGRKVLFCS